jgi:hypothetical protein
MLFALFYVLAITILIMHFTGFLARHKPGMAGAGARCCRFSLP